MHGKTITHQVTGVHGAGKVLLRPASEGTGVIAGGGVRAVLELAGIHDVLSKSLGSQNPINLVRATVEGLKQLRSPKEIAELRGLTVAQVLGLDEKPRNGAAAEAAPADAAAQPAPVTAEAVAAADAPAAAPPAPAEPPAAAPPVPAEPPAGETS